MRWLERIGEWLEERKPEERDAIGYFVVVLGALIILPIIFLVIWLDSILNKYY
jgi:hypothetical protein